ncbi:MAG: DUF4271 domain-containing protein [Bacteroidota bacterium]
MRTFLVGLFFMLMWPLALPAQRHVKTKADLRERWMVYEGQWLEAAASEDYQSVFFAIDAITESGNYVQVRSVSPFSVWLNGKLLGQFAQETTLSVDSLARLYGSEWSLNIRAGKGTPFLETRLINYVSVPVEAELVPRTRNAFLDFSIVVSITLGLYFVLLFQSNPRLTLDYFNFIKLFSIQERDENLVAGRVTSSINLVIYVFIALWLSFLLMVVFHHTQGHWVVANYFSFTSVPKALLYWLLFSLAVLGALFAKIIIALIATGTYKFREAYVIQVFNFFRLLVFVGVIFSCCLLIYFVGDVRESVFFNRLATLLGWVLGGWFVLAFFKLMSKSPFTAFHLFSYLCATEIFPLVIYYEVLFF